MLPRDLLAFSNQLEKKGTANIYLLLGDDYFLSSTLLDLIRRQALEGAIEDLNYDSFSATASDLSRVRDAVETLPMMAPRRLVVLKDVERLNDSQQEVLMPLFIEPVTSTTFVLIAEKVDKRKKFFKEILAKSETIELKRPYENQVPEWVDFIVAQYGKKLAPQERTLLIELVGFNLTDISNEVRKLSQFVGDTEIITSGDILQVISPVRLDSVFDLAMAIGNNDQTQALTHLANLLDHGQNEVGALALVARHLRIISALKDGQRQGLSNVQLASKVGVPSFFLKQYLDQSRVWNKEKLTLAFEALLETDRALKSSPVSSHIWLENFILKSCSSVS
jgi:DNA polymerase-3 subunit delta